jgi:hypothetical protein
MKLEIENAQVEYLLNVLAQRPLGEALALFETVRDQMRAEIASSKAMATRSEPRPQLVPQDDGLGGGGAP